MSYSYKIQLLEKQYVEISDRLIQLNQDAQTNHAFIVALSKKQNHLSELLSELRKLQNEKNQQSDLSK
jgi:hypothetical protein